MENWAFEPEILKVYATHHRTGEVIPDNLIAKIQKASLFNQGFITTELAAAALIDMDIHTLKKASDIDINAFEKYNLEKRGLIPQIEPRYRYTYFAHIFSGGYSSGYYFYLWAEVLDKDAFEAFKASHDLCDKQLAESFRYDLLAQGGQKPGMEMYRKFRGADPDKTPMLKARGLWTEPEPVDSIEPEDMLSDEISPRVAPGKAVGAGKAVGKPVALPKREVK
jgi:peptidyl-dipeptidase Dcp